MKKLFLSIAPLLFIAALLVTSCGPSKKVVAFNAKINQLQKDSANTHSQLNACNTNVLKLTNEKNSLTNENAAVSGDLKDLNASSKSTIAQQSQRLQTLQDMLQAQKDLMDNLKNSISEALMNFDADELTVYIRNGSVYVSLEEKLLFKSGSDVVDPKGKQALSSLAKVLNTTKDIAVVIQGHTDNVPIKTTKFKDNWDLSTARATSIVRILTIDNKFDPKRISAEGSSEFHPVQSNETVEGRASNRRTEIILSPNLKEIDKLLYN